MNERQKKLLALSKYYEVLATAEANSPQTSARAAELVRELFPPMAKALVWFGKRAADYRVSKFEQNQWLPQQLSNSSGWSPKYELIGDVCATEGAAKAACEAHHQARFLEQLA